MTSQITEHKKKSEPFAYWLWVRISTVWCGFQNMNPKDWDISMRNENNIIPVDELKEKVKSEAGFTVTQKDGVLKLSGKNKTETEVSKEKDMSRRKS